MVTLRYLCKFFQHKIKAKSRASALRKCPQKKGVCIRVFTTNPKKPNSAKRKVARVLLSTKKRITTYIVGEGHTLQKYSRVLVKGGRIRDLPGVNYRLIRGKYDFLGIKNRSVSRSKYGTKKSSKS